jgi:adenosine/AMP kinase
MEIELAAVQIEKQVLVAEAAQGHAIIGVVEGAPPQGVEGDADIARRKNQLRQVGYKL